MRFYTACKCAKNWLEMGEMVLKTRFCSIKVVKTTNIGVEMCEERMRVAYLCKCLLISRLRDFVLRNSKLTCFLT